MLGRRDTAGTGDASGGASRGGAAVGTTVCLSCIAALMLLDSLTGKVTEVLESWLLPALFIVAGLVAAVGVASTRADEATVPARPPPLQRPQLQRQQQRQWRVLSADSDEPDSSGGGGGGTEAPLQSRLRQRQAAAAPAAVELEMVGR